MVPGRRQTITVSLRRDDPRVRYTLDVVTGLLGVRWRPASLGEPALIEYGGDRSDGTCCHIPADLTGDWDDPNPSIADVAGLPALSGRALPPARAEPPSIGFDILRATYAFLTAPWERIDPVNAVHTPIAADGWPARHRLLSEPVVHRYADAIGQRLRERGVPARLPAPSLVVTHDVDIAFRRLFGIREGVLRLGRDLRALRPSAVRRAAGLTQRIAESAIRRNGPGDFEVWQELARVLSFRPTYFVASFGLFDRSSAKYDVAYDVRDERVSAELRRLIAEGAEIGLHASLGSADSATRIRIERERLEEATGASVRAARHHWWALGRSPEQTLARQAEAGIQLDSSFGLNDRAGFRRGIAAPFHPFDGATLRALPIWSLPNVVMDAAVCRDGGSPNDVAQELDTLLETTVRLGCALVLDWHTHAFDPSLHGAGDALAPFLRAAAERGIAFRTPLELSERAAALAAS